MKKLFLTLLCAPLLMTGCLSGSDYEAPTLPPFTFNQLQFKGKMTATPLSGSEFTKFTQEDVVFSILPPEEPEKDQRVTLRLQNVRFVEQMSRSIECTYPNLVLTAWPYDMHLTAAPSSKDPIYPYYHGLPLDINQDGVPDPEYLTTDLQVDIVFANDKITKGGVKFKCYTLEVLIEGDPIN